MHIGVIASMKKGLEHFIYREVRELARAGVAITVLPTKHAPGLYMPDAEWRVVRWRLWAVSFSQLWRLLQMPLRYLSVLLTAVRYRAVTSFLLAAYFSKFIGDVDVIYATFGDQKLFVGY